MYIKELILEEFASAVNQKITLDRSFNLITGANETGKSTVCAFIKFMLYGYDDSKEKNRYASIKTGNSSGSMTLVKNDKVYRITRRVSGRINTVSVYDEADGSEFTEWRAHSETPGEYFLCIPSALYTRSVYVSQADGSHLDGGSAEAISNLLLTGDEALNLKKAKKILDDTRKALRLKRGVGGIIAKCEAELAELKTKKAAAIDERKALEAVSLALQREQESLTMLKAKLDNARKTMALLKAKKLLNRLSELDRLNAEQSSNDAYINELTASNTFNGFIPDEKYEAELLSLSKELSLYSEQIQSTKQRADELREKLHAVPPKGYEAFCALGKSKKILPSYRLNISLFRFVNIAFFVCLFLLFVCAVAYVIDYFGLSNTGIIIKSLLWISLGGGAVFGIARFFPKKSLSKLASALGSTQTHTPFDVCRECEQYEQNASSNELGYLSKILDENKEKHLAAEEKIHTLLALWGKQELNTALSDFRAFKSRLSYLSERKKQISGDISVLNAYLSEYTDGDIANARALPMETVFPSDGAVSEEYIHSLISEISDISDRCKDYEISLASSSLLPNIDALSDEIESKEERLAEYTAKYDAVTLATQALEYAENSIRKTVSPYLSEGSSEIFTRITGGKYIALRLDAQMNLSYIPKESESVTDSMYFSSGSADLAWLCLRLALHKRLSESTPIPIILDEALVYFDDTRLKLILRELADIANDGVQIILLSASSREKELLQGNASCITLA